MLAGMGRLEMCLAVDESEHGGDIWEVAAPAFVDLSALLQRAVAPVRQLPLSAPAERPAARHAHNISRRLSSSTCCWPRGRPAGAGVRGAVCDGVAHLCGGLGAVAVPRYWQEKLVAQQVQLILAGSGRPAAALNQAGWAATRLEVATRQTAGSVGRRL